MNITEEKLLEYLSKALVCVAVIVIGYIITKLIIGILRKILNKSRMDGTAEGFVLSVLKVISYFIVAVTALGTIGECCVAYYGTRCGSSYGRSCITGFAEKCCQRTCNFDKQTVCVG